MKGEQDRRRKKIGDSGEGKETEKNRNKYRHKPAKEKGRKTEKTLR